MSYFNKHSPLKKCYLKSSNKEWVNEDIKNSSRNLKILFEQKKDNQKMTEAYRETKRKHFNLIKTTKKKYYQNRIMNSSNYSRTAWKVTKEITKKENDTQKNLIIKVENKIEEDQEKIVNLFN